MKIERLATALDPDWLRLRLELWPDGRADEHLDEMAAFLVEPERYAQFIARSAEQGAVGFAEASIRTDHVNGTKSAPVAFLEGLYVSPGARKRGVARALVEVVAQWATSRGCVELASDTPIENEVSQAVHRKLGFAVTERVVYFNKTLKPTNAALPARPAVEGRVSSNVRRPINKISMLSDEDQIRAIVQTWQSATKAGDINTVLGLMTDDVVFLVPGRPPMRKAEFAALSQVPPGSPRPKFEGTSEIQEVQVSGDMAFVWTKLSVAVTPPGASQAIERVGYTLTVLRREHGEWLLARDANLLSPVQRSST